MTRNPLARSQPLSIARRVSLCAALGILLLGLAAWGDDVSFEAFADAAYRKHSGFEASLETLRTYDRSALAPEERLSYDILEWYLKDQIFHRPILLGDRPSADVAYEEWLRHHTTSDISPEELYERLQDEVTRTQELVEDLFESLGIEAASMAERMVEVHARGIAITQESGLAVSDEMQGYVDRAEDVMRSWFGLYPNEPIVVTPVPGMISIAGFRAGSEAQGRPHQVQIEPGLNGVPYYLRKTVSHHEGFPGHYVQESVAWQIEDLPYFRSQMGARAYGEGWALYGEQVAWENGLFDDADPLHLLGFVESQLWRSARALADVGLHAMGWSDERAEELLIANLGVDSVKARAMIEGYRASPGSAVDSSSGFLTFMRLRNRMAEALGTEYRIVEYHRLVLEHGPMPMQILERVVEAAIAGVPYGEG